MSSRPLATAAQRAAVHPRDGVSTRRTAVAALAAVATLAATLGAMVLVPELHARRAAPAQRLLLEVVAPTRDELTALHLALAVGGSLLLDVVGGDTVGRDDLAAVRLQADSARRLARTLDARAARLRSDAVGRHAVAVRDAVDAWHADVVRAAAAPSRRERARLARHWDTLLEVARLDAAVAHVAAQLTADLRRRERIARRITTALGAAAFVGLLVTGWLGVVLRRSLALADARRRALAELVDARARFVRGLTHDLRHPLTTIDGHAWLLASGRLGPVTEGQRATLDRLRAGVAGLGALVDDLLEFARTESGALPVRLAPGDLAQVVRGAAVAHRPACERAGLALDVRVPDAPCPVVTDARRVAQVLDNLVSNAVKYTPRGGRIALSLDGTAHHGWRVAVADTGPGIPPDRREFVFEEFSRLPDTHAPGAGLGLAIARRIARRLGGELWVEATPPGAGARFVLELPREAPAPADADARIAMVTAAGAAPA